MFDFLTNKWILRYSVLDINDLFFRLIHQKFRLNFPLWKSTFILPKPFAAPPSDLSNHQNLTCKSFLVFSNQTLCSCHFRVRINNGKSHQIAFSILFFFCIFNSYFFQSINEIRHCKSSEIASFPVVYFSFKWNECKKRDGSDANVSNMCGCGRWWDSFTSSHRR